MAAPLVKEGGDNIVDQLQERYDLLQMGANKLRDKALAAVKGGHDEMEALAAFLFYTGDLD